MRGWFLRRSSGLALAFMLTVAGVNPRVVGAAALAAGLKIVVIEGEDAVNIIQQKTAVAPVVEVRDTNDQPVAGAVVRFAIQGESATLNGALQINATATFQQQTAVATFSQTNVLTAASVGIGLVVVASRPSRPTTFPVEAPLAPVASVRQIMRGLHARSAEWLADDLLDRWQAVHRRGGERRGVLGRVHRVHVAQLVRLSDLMWLRVPGVRGYISPV